MTSKLKDDFILMFTILFKENLEDISNISYEDGDADIHYDYIDDIQNQLSLFDDLSRIHFRSLVLNEDDIKSQIGFSFESKAYQLRLIIKCLCKWISKTQAKFLFSIKYKSALLQCSITNPEDLSKIKFATEKIIQARHIYLSKVEELNSSHIDLTPSEEAGLSILAQRLNLSQSEIKTLREQFVGIFPDLEEKKKYFEKILIKVSQENRSLNDSNWRIMVELAKRINLPLDIAIDLWQTQIQSILLAKESKELDQQNNESILTSESGSEPLPISELVISDEAKEEIHASYRELFRQCIFHQQEPLDFDKGRLMTAREIWQISSVKANELEEKVRDIIRESLPNN